MNTTLPTLYNNNRCLVILNHESAQAQWVELAVLDYLFMHLLFTSTSFSK